MLSKKIVLRDLSVKIMVGDLVTVFRRKANGYPKKLKDDEFFKVLKVDGDKIYLDLNGIAYGVAFHKDFFITKEYKRELVLKELLDLC